MAPQSDKGERGWFWPTAARKAHFDGGDGSAGLLYGCGPDQPEEA